MHLFRSICLILLSVLALQSCNNNAPETKPSSKEGSLFEKEKPRVNVMELKTGVFYKEILSNGKLYALRKAELKFRVSEEIEKIHVKNGDAVQTNEALAVVNSFEYYNRLQSARVQYDKARTEMQNVLIGQGYDIKDSANIAPTIWKIAADKSGLTEANINFETAQFNYQNTTLRAPFNGVIADLKLKEHNMAPVSESFCKLIDNSVFNAEFQVLESELENIALGQPVVAVPFSTDSFSQTGNISEINPLIDENGLVTVKAQINNSQNKLFEGMNVRISIRKPCPGQLVVPKQAVLQRQGKEVVFTLENGRAMWKYVKTGDENAGFYTITEGLTPGMKVIISNNLNLGHDAEVEVNEIVKE